MEIPALKFKNNSQLNNFKFNECAREYSGCSYCVDRLRLIERTSKVTPKKVGQFVTLWKRTNDNLTSPLDLEDDFDFVIIICRSDNQVGKFIFPKSILLEKNYIRLSSKSSGGKRGFRVYPEWDRPVSKQAVKTKSWQAGFFSRGLEIDAVYLENISQPD